MALSRPVICVVTGGHGDSPRIVAALSAAARAGASVLQIREPGLDDRQLLSLVQQAIAATATTAARVVVNDRTDVAIAASAAGVHLRDRSIAASRVRAVAPPGFLIGRAVHSVAAAREAEADGACDYLVFGTVFPSASKPPGHQAAGLRQLEAVCQSVRLPVLAIGGITPGRAAEVARAGAAGIAAIGLFATAASAGDAVDAVRRSFDSNP